MQLIYLYCTSFCIYKTDCHEHVNNTVYFEDQITLALLNTAVSIVQLIFSEKLLANF